MESRSGAPKSGGDVPRTSGWGEEPLPPWDTLFAYDRWANERWIAFARSRRWKGGDDLVEHIVRASEAWLSRIHREEPVDPSASTLEMRLAACHMRWIQTLRDLTPAKVIRYANMAGVRYESYLGDIAAHVINHGTYHRGQLRERAGAEGFDDYPDTDLILFIRESAPHGSP
ncbi:MAG: DinB family protein [Armatimonadota bacterium]